MKRFFALVPVIAFLALAGYFAVSLRPNHDPNELPSALLDQPAPDFDLPGLSGISLRGQVVVVNFFASWCVPCRVEHPVLMRLAAANIPLYGIAYKDKPADTTHLLGELGTPYRAYGADTSGRTGIDFGVYGVPETYVIDRAGRIRLRFVGPLSAARVDHELLPLLARLNAP